MRSAQDDVELPDPTRSRCFTRPSSILERTKPQKKKGDSSARQFMQCFIDAKHLATMRRAMLAGRDLSAVSSALLQEALLAQAGAGNVVGESE